MFGGTWVLLPGLLVISATMTREGLAAAHTLMLLWSVGTLIFAAVSIPADWHMPAKRWHIVVLALAYMVLFVGCARNIFVSVEMLGLVLERIDPATLPAGGVTVWLLNPLDTNIR